MGMLLSICTMNKHSLFRLLAGLGLLWSVDVLAAQSWESHSFDVRLGVAPGRPPPQPEPVFESQTITTVDTADRRALVDLVNRIRRSRQQGELETALRQADVGRSIHGDIPILLIHVAEINTLLNRLEAAEEAWRIVAGAVPDEMGMLASWMAVLLRLERWSEAEEVAARARRIDPYFTYLVYYQFINYVATDRPEPAERVIRSMSAADLAAITGWFSHGTEGVIRHLDPAQFVVAGEILLRGGEPDAGRAEGMEPIVPITEGFLPISVPDSSVDDRPADEAAAEIRERLQRVSRVLNQFGQFVQNEDWSRAAALGRHQGMRQLGFVAPSYRAYALYAAWRNGEEEGAERLQRLANRYPDHLHVGLRYIDVLLDRRDYADAEALLARLDQQFPRHILVTLLRAAIAAEQGDAEQALFHLENVDSRYRSFVQRWFTAEASYQQVLLNDSDYALWRATFLTTTDAAD